jgi:hypothetical protein
MRKCNVPLLIAVNEITLSRLERVEFQNCRGVKSSLREENILEVASICMMFVSSNVLIILRIKDEGEAWEPNCRNDLCEVGIINEKSHLHGLVKWSPFNSVVGKPSHNLNPYFIGESKRVDSIGRELLNTEVIRIKLERPKLGLPIHADVDVST